MKSYKEVLKAAAKVQPEEYQNNRNWYDMATTRRVSYHDYKEDNFALAVEGSYDPDSKTIEVYEKKTALQSVKEIQQIGWGGERTMHVTSAMMIAYLGVEYIDAKIAEEKDAIEQRKKTGTRLGSIAAKEAHIAAFEAHKRVLERNKKSEKEEEQKMKEVTKYYLISDDASRYIIAQQGNKTAVFEPDSRLIDKMTGVPLFIEGIPESEEELEMVRKNLSEAYEEVEGLYSMEEIERDFPDKVFTNWENDEISFKGLITVVGRIYFVHYEINEVSFPEGKKTFIAEGYTEPEFFEDSDDFEDAESSAIRRMKKALTKSKEVDDILDVPDTQDPSFKVYYAKDYNPNVSKSELSRYYQYSTDKEEYTRYYLYSFRAYEKVEVDGNTIEVDFYGNIR